MRPESASAPPVSFGKSIHLYEANSDSSSTYADVDELVIMCSWMGAAKRHIAKYVAGYQKQLPDARILLIQSSLSQVTWQSNKHQQRQLAPAVAVIRSMAKTSQATKIILHIFSNGGAQSYCQLGAAYRGETGRHLPVSSIICDSSPGRATWRLSAEAMVLSLPKNPVLRLIGTVLIHLIIAMVFLGDELFGIENVIDKARRQLLDPAFLPPSVPRVYLYSKADRLVLWQDVADHAQAARDKGIEVHEVVFERSAHVSHVMESDTKYWQYIMEAA